MNFLLPLLNSLPGAVTQGLLWGIMAIGVYLTYRILDVADLTVDGSLATGGAMCVVLMRLGVNPWLALLGAFAAGLAAGLITGLLHTRCGIPAILAGILTQLALYSVNLRIMGGKANTPISIDKYDLLVSQRNVRELSLQNPLLLAVLFAAFCALASFGIGNLSQLNSIAGNLRAAFDVPEAATGAVLAAVSAVILLGGLKRVAAVAERLVPAMALLYIVGALTVVGVHITAVPAALAAIVKGAFGLRAAGGGIVGYGLSRAVTWGFKRGAFSNEAGLGSSVMVHAASNVKEPVQQGMWGIFEVFADTMVVCTLTALVVLTSGFVEPDTGHIAAGAAASALVGQAFDAVFGALGSKLIAVCILLFAYSTVLGWSCYGCKAVEYLFGAGAGTFYRVLFVALMPVGAVMRLDLAWTLSDTFNGLMMLPNLIGVIALSGTVVRITQNYLARKLYGSPAPPLLSAGETI